MVIYQNGYSGLTLSEICTQINELVLRCIKSNEVRHYYDIAVIGYGQNVYSGWNGTLAGRDFVSPEELKNNPVQILYKLGFHYKFQNENLRHYNKC